MPKGSWKEFEDPAVKNNLQCSENIPSKAEMPVRIQLMRGGKGGKTVTSISGLNLSVSHLRKLLKNLQARLGTGGTLKTDNIELQGDHLTACLDFLEKQGFRPKRSGG